MRSDRVVFLRKFFIVAAFLVLSVSCRAAAEEGPGECLGIGFEVQHPITIAKVIADRPQVHFIKSAADDSGCPADREACLAPSYLIPGDLVWSAKPTAPTAACHINLRPIACHAGRWVGCHRRP
jgi:hypothetical protein